MIHVELTRIFRVGLQLSQHLVVEGLCTEQLLKLVGVKHVHDATRHNIAKAFNKPSRCLINFVFQLVAQPEVQILQLVFIGDANLLAPGASGYGTELPPLAKRDKLVSLGLGKFKSSRSPGR